MIISNLTYTEFATEANNIEGGIAFADALAEAGAIGGLFAATNTFTATNAVSFGFFSIAGSLSGSASVAA